MLRRKRWMIVLAFGLGTALGWASITIENADYRLTLREDGTAESLLHKASGQECLAAGVRVPAFTVAQDRPYNNELQLAFPAKRKVFPAKSVHRDGDLLVVKFELVDHVMTLRLKVADAYIGFQVEKIEGVTPLDEITFLQLFCLQLKKRIPNL